MRRLVWTLACALRASGIPTRSAAPVQAAGRGGAWRVGSGGVAAPGFGVRGMATGAGLMGRWGSVAVPAPIALLGAASTGVLGVGIVDVMVGRKFGGRASGGRARGMAGGGRRKVPKSQARRAKVKGNKFVGRFKVGKDGKVRRTRSGRHHGNYTMSSRQRRNKRKGAVLPKAYANTYKKAGILRKNKSTSGGSSGGRKP